MTIKKALILCLAGAVALFCIYTARLKFQRDRLEVELADSQKHAAGLALEVEQGRVALAQREAEKKRLIDEKAALTNKLNEVYDNDQEANDWADNPCPDSVLECLLK